MAVEAPGTGRVTPLGVGGQLRTARRVAGWLRPAWVEVDLSAVTANVAYIREVVAPAAVCAIETRDCNRRNRRSNSRRIHTLNRARIRTAAAPATTPSAGSACWPGSISVDFDSYRSRSASARQGDFDERRRDA